MKCHRFEKVCCVNLNNFEFINPGITKKMNICPYCGKVLNLKRLNKVRKDAGLLKYKEDSSR